MSRRRTLLAALALASAGPAVAQDDPAALVGQLASDDASARHAAYSQLQRARSPEALALLTKALPTMPLAGQSLAVYVVDGYPAEQTHAVWKKLSGQGSAYLRVAAASALWHRGDRNVVPALAAAVGAATPAEMTYVLSRLHGVDEPAVFAAVRGFVRKDVGVGVLAEALYYLLQGQKGRDPETVHAVEALLERDDAAAAIARVWLVAAGDGKQAAALAASIRDGTLPLYQCTRFLEGVSRLDAAVVEALLARLEQRPSVFDLNRVVQLLQKHAPQRIAPALKVHLDGDDAPLRAAALKALASVPGALTPPRLGEMLASADAEVVLLAAETLRRMDDPQGLERVIALAQKPGANRAEAVRVLGGFRDPKAVPPLIAAFTADEVQVRRNAVTALQQLLPDLFPYRRFDLERAGCRADAATAQRADGLRLLQAWWDASQRPR